MDTAKAVINLKEGTLQLEGPQEFVEKYLDQYDSIIKNWKTFSTLSPKEEKIETEKPAPKRTRTVKPKAGPTATEKIQVLVDESYFKEPKTRADVQTELLQRGLRYESGLISAVLNNLFKGNKLLKTGVGKKAKFYTNV